MLEFRTIARCLGILLAVQATGALADQSALAKGVDDPDIAWGPCPEFFAPGCEIGVLQGDPARPDADVFFRVPGNYDLPRHWHNSPERMVLVSGELLVRYQGQPAVTLTPGMYAYGPPRLPHDGRCVSDAKCVLFIAFEEPVDAFLANGDQGGR